MESLSSFTTRLSFPTLLELRETCSLPPHGGVSLPLCGGVAFGFTLKILRGNICDVLLNLSLALGIGKRFIMGISGEICVILSLIVC